MIKFLDAGIQDVSTSISIVDDLIERCPGDGDESDKHLEARDRRYSCLMFLQIISDNVCVLQNPTCFE